MKFIFFIFLCVVSLVNISCQSKLEHYLKTNISEIREFVMYGVDDNVSATLICGKREIEYKLNGVSTELIPFGIISVVYEEELIGNELTYVLYVGTEKIEGVLEKNPFDNSYVTDIGKIIDSSKNVSLDILVNNEKKSLKLNSVSKGWKVDYDDCLKILVSKYDKELNSMIKDNKFMGEVYLKIIDDYDKFESDFYFYINIIGVSGESISVLISPLTGEILASKCNI